MTGLQPGAATMTVLFTDLVDSTAMRSRIGDNQADEVRREHDELITRLVDENRGSIVKGLGDGIMAVFGAPSSGIAAAVGIQQAVARRNRGARVPIALKIGLSVGEVRVESDDVYGTPVVEASRLCSASGADQILTAEHVKLLAGSRSTATYREFGELELKGLSEPLRTLEVLWWEASDAPSVPFPDIPALSDDPTFVGRSVEKYAIGHAWLNARTAKAPLVLVTGPPGIGKSRLIADFSRRTTQNEGGLVLYGRCSEGGGPAFQPFAEAIRFYVSNVPSGQLADLLGGVAGELARIVPELVEQIPGARRAAAADPEFETMRMFDAVAAWLAAASRDEPMVLILDDLQWASGSTIDLLRHIAESPTPMRVLIIAIAADGGPAEEKLDALHERLRTTGHGVEPISLRGLTVDDVGALLGDVIGDLGDATGALAARVHERTEGNPLFTAEIGRGLVKAGIAASADDGATWTIKGDITQLMLPPTVESAITALVAVLGDNAVKVLQPASIVGDEFDLPVVRSLVPEMDDETFTKTIDAAVAAGLLDELPGGRQRYTFVHSVQRHALEATVSVDQRADWHRRIVTEIERNASGDVDRYAVDLARHHVAAMQGPGGAAAGDSDAAVAACLRVADRARDQLAADEAVTWYRHAVELLEPASDNQALLPILLALGEVEHRAGHASARETLLRAATLAKAAGDNERLIAAVLANTREFTGRAAPIDPERITALRDAAAASADAPAGVRAKVLALLASELVWHDDADSRFELADEALSLARSLDDDGVLAYVLLLRLPTIAAPDTLDERIELSDELSTLAATRDVPVLRFHAAMQRAIAAGEAGDIETFDSSLGIAAMVASGLDMPLLTWLVALSRASRAYLGGDLAAAERHADEALAAGKAAGRPEAELFHGAVVLAVRQLQGRIEEVAADIDPATSSPSSDMFLLSRAVADAGRIDEVEPQYQAIAAEGFPIGREPYALATLTNLAYLAALVPGAEGVDTLYDKLTPFAERFPSVVVFQHVGAHSLGMLAATLERTDDANDWFEQAIELHKKVDAPLMVAETQLEWARVCYGTGNVDRARELIGKALASAVKGNAAGLEAQARELLSAAFGSGDAEPAPSPEPVSDVEADREPDATPDDDAGAEPIPVAVESPTEAAAAPTAEFVVPPLPPVPPPPAPIPVYTPSS